MITEHETSLSKYEMVGSLLKGARGELIDLGARDRTLKAYLGGAIDYRAVDLVSGADHAWDLEQPLPIGDRSVDFVVALDVLEHLEGIHATFREILRVTRHRVLFSVPNVACLSMRLRFFFGTGFGDKHAVLPHHQGDRHRWLTTWRQMRAFIEANLDSKEWTVHEYALTRGYGRLHAAISALPLPRPLRAYTLLYDLERRR